MNLKLFYDTETTGLPVWNEPSEGANQPHLVQLAALLVDIDDNYKIVSSINVIIHPNGWEIPEEVVAIHGITTEMAKSVGVNEGLAIEMFINLWHQANARVAHNQSFDERIIRIGLKRYFEGTAEQWKEGEKECTGLLAKPIMQMLPKNKFGFKMPKLSEAYLHFLGVQIEDEHTAMGDTLACMEVYRKIKALNS